MKTILVAMRMLRRNWSAGELRVLLLALLSAVGSVTTVGFFADRVQAALDQQANELLGADLVVIADHRLGPAYGEAAAGEPDREVEGGPKPGTVWIGAPLVGRIGVKVGDVLQVGRARLTVAKIIT